VEAAVAAAEKHASGLIERVAEAAKADWFVRVAGDRVCLVPAAGWDSRFTRSAAKAPPGAAPAQFLLGSTADGPELARKLKTALSGIARARQLLQLAGAGEVARGGDSAVDVEVELLRYKDQTDPGATVVPHGPDGRRLQADQWIAFRVHNLGRLAADVTLLFVDSGYGIHAVFPPPGTAGDNRLEAGKSLTTPRVKVTADTVGAEQVVAIAVRAGRDRGDFTCLEQPTLERARGTAGAVQTLDSPFGRLIQSAMYGSGTTRGLAVGEVQAYAVRLLPWVTDPR
jgi:hypothetical protein